MPLRSGGFGTGVNNLDPFGGSRGGLGRYNLGSDIASIEAYEAYAIAVGWQNGGVTDADYLASLSRQVELAPANSKEKVSAQNKYDDAVYTIARNKIVNDVNLSTSTDQRVANLQRLAAHDKARMGQMVEDNEQRREIAAKIRGTEGDIRSTEYGNLVESYNRGKATTAQLIAFVNGAIGQSAGAPDAENWSKTLKDLVDRRNDEIVASRQQDYQNNRDPGGKSLLQTLIDQRAGLTVGSPKYDQVSRQIEDLQRTVRENQLATSHADLFNKWQEGKVSDSKLLADLETQVKEAPPGSRQEVEAKASLISHRFSLAEDKIRDDVDKGVRGKGDLVRFYQGYLKTMVPDSYRARQIAAAIRTLQGSGGGGGGGGGGGSSSSKPLAGLGKLLGVPIPWKNAVAATKDVNGHPIPKGAVAALLAFNASDVTDRAWYANNRTGLDFAFDQGESTWLFTARNGQKYVLPFNTGLYKEFLKVGEAGFRSWADNARNPKEAQSATSQWWTATQRLVTVNQTVTMDEYQSRFDYLERRKKEALTSNDIATYMTYLSQQNALVRTTLGITGGQTPTDINNATAMLTPDQKARIAADIDHINPYQADPNNVNGEPMNTKGDKVGWAVDNGVIKYSATLAPDGSYVDVTNVSMDANKAYLTQDNFGTMQLVTIADSQGDFELTSVAPGVPPVPKYQLNLAPITIFSSAAGSAAPDTSTGQTVWMKPTLGAQKGQLMLQLDGSGGLTVGGGVTSNVAPITGTTTNQVVGNSAQVKQNVPVLLPDGTGGVPLWSVTVYGWGPNGKELQTWVSLQKPGTAWAKWVRTPTGGQTPRIVLDPSSLGSGARFTIKGNQLQILNADGSTGAIPQGFDWGTVARFYDSRDGTGAAAGFGAPGQEYEQATSDAEGKVSFYKAPIKQPFDVYGSKITRLLDEHPKVVEPGLPRPEREQGMQPSKYDYRVPADRTAAGGLGLPAVATYTPDESASLADFRAGERGSLNPTPATPIRSYAPTARLPMPDDLLPGAMRTELRPPPPVEPLVPVPTPPTPIRSYAPRPVPVLKPIVKPNQALIDKMTKADKATTPPPPKPTPLPTPSQTQIDRNTAKIR